MNQGKGQDFTTLEQREKIIQEMDTLMSQYGKAKNNQSSVEIEAHIHQKARSKEEYMKLISRFLIHLKEVTGAPNTLGNIVQSQPGTIPQVVAPGLTQQVTGRDDHSQIRLGQQIQIQGQPRAQMLQVSNPAQIQQQQLIQQTTPQIVSLSNAAQLSGIQNLISTPHLGTQQAAGNVSFVTGAQGIQVSQQGLSSQLGGNISINQASYQNQLKQLQTRKAQQMSPAQQQNRQQPQKAQHLVRSNQSPAVNQQPPSNSSQGQYSIPSQKSHPSPSPSQVHQVYQSRPDPSPVSSIGAVAQSPLSTQPSPSPSAAATPGNPPSWGGPAQSPLDASEESAYAEKLKEIAKYIEPLRSLINNMPKDGEHAPKIKKLKQIELIFTNKKRVSLAFLTKCEQIVNALLSSDTAGNQKPTMLQTVTDHLVPLAGNPSLISAAHQCIQPVLNTLNMPTVRPPKAPRKRRRSSSDDEDCSLLPDALQMEIAHLWSRFSFDLDMTSKLDKSFFTISCRPKTPKMSSLPPLLIKVPACYPKRTPDYTLSYPDNDENMLLNCVKKNFLSRLLESSKGQFHSVTYILESWEQSLKETLYN